MGDAGAIVTSDTDLADRMAMFARHGGLLKGEHHVEGINSRLDGLQAAVLSVKLRHLEAWTRTRRVIAQQYDRALGGIVDLQTPFAAGDREHVYHLYVVRHARRDALAKYLKTQGVQTAINYPVALPFLPAYARLGHRHQDFPRAFANQGRILSLPIFCELTEAQLQRVVGAISRFTP
jgi:dTDP-4-amino-4,6-dideoxygalactose transaminase